MKGFEEENAFLQQLFLKMCPTMPWKAYYFLHFLQAEPLFEPHYSAQSHILLPCNPSQRLFHIPELKYHFPVFHQVVCPGHFWSSHITHFTYIDFNFLNVLMLVPVRLWQSLNETFFFRREISLAYSSA